MDTTYLTARQAVDVGRLLRTKKATKRFPAVAQLLARLEKDPPNSGATLATMALRAGAAMLLAANRPIAGEEREAAVANVRARIAVVEEYGGTEMEQRELRDTLRAIEATRSKDLFVTVAAPAEEYDPEHPGMAGGAGGSNNGPAVATAVRVLVPQGHAHISWMYARLAVHNVSCEMAVGATK